MVVISNVGLRIIGEDKTLSIKVGAEVGDSSTEDVIFVRGVSSDVDRAIKEIYKILQDAKNDEIINSYVRSCCDTLQCSYLTLTSPMTVH